MIVGKRKPVSDDSALGIRSRKSIDYAISQIQNSPLSKYVDSLYLYGSCARREQKFGSDVDLFLVLNDKCSLEQHKSEIFALKGCVTPVKYDLPEVDLTVVIGNDWRQNNLGYYKNIIQDGVSLWLPLL